MVITMIFMNLIGTFIFSSLVIFPIFLPQIIFAQEFDFEFIDSKIYPISYKLTNVTLIDVIQNPPTDFAFVINGTDGQLLVSIPKNIPRDIADTFPIGYIIFNGVEMDKAVESNCSYDYTFPIDKESRVEFIFGSPPSGTPLVYDEISPECDERINHNSDVHVWMQKTSCSNENLVKLINVRNETVCISPFSINSLLERGYLLSSVQLPK
jgi:hypothetical protein